MSTTDSRPLHIYRIPRYQKRRIGVDVYASYPYSRSPSPSRALPISERRHSTPPISTLLGTTAKSSSSKTIMKDYNPYTGPSDMNRKQSSLSDSIHSTPDSITQIKRGRRSNRSSRTTTTVPTSLSSITDISLPVAKKNRNKILYVPSHSMFDIQSGNRSPSLKRSKRNLQPIAALDFGHDLFTSDEEDEEHYSKDGIHTSNSIKCSKWYERKCFHRFSLSTICQWCYNYPYCCWALFFLLLLGLFIGVIILVGFFDKML